MTRTNAFSVLCVLIRAFSLWLFVKTLIAIPGFVIQDAFGEHWIWLLGATFGLPMLIALAMWVFADQLTRLALARPSQVVFDSDIAAAQWQTIAFSVVGLLQVISGISDIVYHVAKIAVLQYTTDAHYPVSSQLSLIFYAGMIDAVMHLMIGLGLLFGARGIVALLHRIRGQATVIDSDESADK